MRLWHYKLIPVLPQDMLVSQWRECIAIKRQWEKGTLKHRLVSYVKDYDPLYFLEYVVEVLCEMDRRNIKYQKKFYDEIHDFCYSIRTSEDLPEGTYPEHNPRYLRQCYNNLEEKYDRGIVSEKEFSKVLEVYEFEQRNKFKVH